MDFVFTSRNKRFFDSFSKILCSENDSIIFYYEIVELSSDLITKKISPDIIIIDGFYFLQFKNFIFRFLNDFKREIPAIFIDSSVSKKLRVARWLSEIELCFDNPTYHYLIPVLEKIDKILELPVCKNAISTGNEKNLKSSKIPLKQKFLLTPVNHLLYEFFFKNRRRVVFLDEIADILKLHQNEKKLVNKVYAYISRFRKSIKQTNCRYELLRICKGGYQFVLKN